MQHAPHIANHRFGRQRAERHDLADRFFAVFFAYIFNHAATVGLAEVDIEVRHGHAFGVQETLEQQRVFQRVKVGNLQRIRHQRACTRTTTRPHRAAVLFCPVDKVLHNQKIAREAHLDNRLQLEIQTRLIFGHFCVALLFIGIQHFHTFAQTLIGQHAQIIIQRHTFWRRKIRQEILAQFQFHITAFGNFQRIGQCGRQIGKTFRHFFRAREILAVGKIMWPLVVRHHPAAGNAHTGIVRCEVFALQKLGRMGRHHRQIQLLRQVHAARHYRFPFRLIRQTLHFQIKRLFKPRRIFFCSLQCLLLMPRQQCLSNFAPLRTRQANQARIVAFRQPFFLQLRRYQIAVFVSVCQCQQLAQAHISRMIANQQQGTERLCRLL